MESWQDVLTFVQRELDEGPGRGYPATLLVLINILYKLAKECGELAQYLQDPENLIHKICANAQCRKVFAHPNRWVKTCSIKCHNQWLKDPDGYMKVGDNNRGSTVALMQQKELEEKT